VRVEFYTQQDYQTEAVPYIRQKQHTTLAHVLRCSFLLYIICEEVSWWARTRQTLRNISDDNGVDAESDEA
jgi:hypothetical protein